MKHFSIHWNETNDQPRCELRYQNRTLGRQRDSAHEWVTAFDTRTTKKTKKAPKWSIQTERSSIQIRKFTVARSYPFSLENKFGSNTTYGANGHSTSTRQFVTILFHLKEISVLEFEVMIIHEESSFREGAGIEEMKNDHFTLHLTCSRFCFFVFTCVRAVFQYKHGMSFCISLTRRGG